MRLTGSILLILFLCLRVSAYCSPTALTNCPVTAWPALPASGGKFTDPDWGTEIMRVTDAAVDATGCITPYSYWQGLNSDNTRLLAQCTGGTKFFAFTPSTFTLGAYTSYSNVTLMDFNNGYYWSQTNPDLIYAFSSLDTKLYQYNVATNTQSVVKDFASVIGAGKYVFQPSMSDDRTVIGFTVRLVSDFSYLGYMVYNLTTNTVLLNVTDPRVNEVHVSRGGTHASADLDGPQAVRLWNLANTSSSQYLLFYDPANPSVEGMSHNTMDFNYVVGFTATNISTVSRWAFTDLVRTTLLSLDFGGSAHLSCLADNISWTLASRHDAPPIVSAPFHNELFLVNSTTSSGVYRFAHPHNEIVDYQDHSFANISRDGKWVVFSSNNDSSGRRDVFVAHIPASPAALATSWYVRTDGAAFPTCNGQSNASSASTPNCAFANPQEAINAASLGDTINLRAGDTFTGNFSLPLKSGSSYLTIQSTGVGSLPAGVRVNPSQTSLMAKLQSNNVDAVVYTPDLTASHHYKFIGIEFSLNADNGFSVIRLGDSNQTSLAQVSNNIVFDRSYIHGQPTYNSQRGITMNSSYTDVTNSYISDIHWVGIESQAIGGWNGPGPFNITNNYLEAAGIQILFGGAQASIPGLVPSDILINNNYMFKPLSWRIGDPSYAGIPWTVKNLFELKNARRVTVTNNLMENSWPHAQIGWAVIFNSFRDHGEVVEDVTISRNTFLNTTYGIDLRGRDAPDPVVRMKRITIEDNYITNLGAYAVSGSGPTAFLMLNSSEDVTINHNTISGTVVQALGFGGDPAVDTHLRFNFSNQLMPFGTYGVFGDGGFFGTAALNQYAGTGNWTFARNALYGDMGGQSPSQYPLNNYFPVNLAAAIGLPGTDGYPVGVRNNSQICRWNTTPTCQ